LGQRLISGGKSDIWNNLDAFLQPSNFLPPGLANLQHSSLVARQPTQFCHLHLTHVPAPGKTAQNM
jgi:hypothetical protein